MGFTAGCQHTAGRPPDALVFFYPRHTAYPYHEWDVKLYSVLTDSRLCRLSVVRSVMVTSTCWTSVWCAQQQVHLPSVELPDDRSYCAWIDPYNHYDVLLFECACVSYFTSRSLAMCCICALFTVAAKAHTLHAAMQHHCKLRRHCDITIIEKKSVLSKFKNNNFNIPICNC